MSILESEIMKSSDDELWDIHNKPDNFELKTNLVVGILFLIGIGGVAPLFILHWLGLRQWALIGIPLLLVILCLTAHVKSLKRRGAKSKELYISHGGDPSGTSDILFGLIAYSITPDGRWKWPEKTYSSD